MKTLQLWTFPFCPTAPTWQLDWPAIERHFVCIRQMADCPQNPLYHAEGDVLTHTRLVCEALVRLPAWRQLPESERSVLFAAALFHDVGKPLCTRIDPEGNITSRGHVPRGARFTRQLFWEGEAASAPFKIREQIVALVRFSGLPFHFLDESNPQYAVIRASQQVRCDWLSILAEADLGGRICNDSPQMLEKIALFREFCAENHCLDKPYTFASDHSRFIYFRKENSHPEYVAYDDTRFEVVLMCALPGTGKDYWIAHNLQGWPIVSLDALREEMDIAPEDEQGPVIAEARELARIYLRQHKSFVWNATNVTRSRRGRLIDLFVDYGARVRIVYLEVPPNEVLRRNRERERIVPEGVIWNMAAHLELPEITEAHRVEWIVQASNC